MRGFISGSIRRMRRVALIVALNLVAAVIYAVVAAQTQFFGHLHETLFSSPDSLTYHDVANWLLGAAPNPIESTHRPFLYPLLLGISERIGGAPGIWILNLACWLGMLNLTAAATWRMTGRPALGAIVFLVLATNVSVIVLSFQALTESLTVLLESIWILGLALSALPPTRPRDLAMLLLPISLLTVVKPGYEIELIVALILLAITIWRMPRGRALATLVVGVCVIPVLFQVGLMATANHFVGVSKSGEAELKLYYASQVYASLNGLPDDLVAARVIVGPMSDVQVVEYLLNHPRTAVGTLVGNLHFQVTGERANRECQRSAPGHRLETIAGEVPQHLHQLLLGNRDPHGLGVRGQGDRVLRAPLGADLDQP